MVYLDDRTKSSLLCTCIEIVKWWIIRMILQKKDKDNVRPTWGKLYILSRKRKKNGSIVNENAAKVIVCIFKSFFRHICISIFIDILIAITFVCMAKIDKFFVVSWRNFMCKWLWTVYYQRMSFGLSGRWVLLETWLIVTIILSKYGHAETWLVNRCKNW